MSVTAVNPLASVTAPSQSSSTPTATADPLVSKDTFLQLLVAQIKNQDPLQPTDGVQFLSQLAQFSEVEQLVAIHQGIDTLNQSQQQSNGSTPPPSTPATPPATGSTQAVNGTQS